MQHDGTVVGAKHILREYLTHVALFCFICDNLPNCGVQIDAIGVQVKEKQHSIRAIALGLIASANSPDVAATTARSEIARKFCHFLKMVEDFGTSSATLQGC